MNKSNTPKQMHRNTERLMLVTGLNYGEARKLLDNAQGNYLVAIDTFKTRRNAE